MGCITGVSLAGWTVTCRRTDSALELQQLSVCCSSKELQSAVCPCHHPHLDKVTQLLGGTRLGIRCHVSTICTTRRIRPVLLAGAVLALLVPVVLAVPLLPVRLVLGAVPRPLGAALILFKALNPDAPRRRGRGGLKRDQLRSCCCSLRKGQSTWSGQVRECGICIVIVKHRTDAV